MSAKPSAYVNDHSKAVLATHSWRTAENSAAYLIPHLRPSFKILDIGCGPGSITVDLAKLVPQGHVTGIEYSSAPLPRARALAAERGVSNTTFGEGDIHALPFEDNSFDVVHAHQVLQHIADPVLGIREMRRVAKPGGLVACRESASMTCYPDSPLMVKNGDLINKVAEKLGSNPHPGRRIHVWAKEAGFQAEDVKCSTGTWCFSTREEREYWGGTFAERARKGQAVEKIIEGGFATREEMEEIAQEWRDWVENEDGWFGVLHGEILCTKRA